MNIFLNEYFGFCFELNFELNHFLARFNEKMNFQTDRPGLEGGGVPLYYMYQRSRYSLE